MRYSRGPDAVEVPWTKSPPEGDDPEWCMLAGTSCSVAKGAWLFSRASARPGDCVVGRSPAFAQVGCEEGKEAREGEGD